MAPPGKAKASLTEFKAAMRLLVKESPPMLWVVFVVMFFESVAWFSVSMILKTYMVDNLGFTDVSAGLHFGARGLLTTVIGVLLGVPIDKFGVRPALILGTLLLFVSRLSFGLAQSQWFFLMNLYVINPMGNSLALPVLSMSVKRLSTTATKTVAYGVTFVVMNVGWAVGGIVTDIIRRYVKHGKNGSISVPLGEQMTCYRVIAMMSSMATLICVILGIAFVKDIEVDEDTRRTIPFVHEHKGGLWSMVKKLLRNPKFGRYVVLVCGLLGVRTLLSHLGATFPQYLEREYGTSVSYGTIVAINPILVIVLTLVFTAFTMHVGNYTMLEVGTCVAAASPFFLCGIHISTAIIFIVILSVGEAMCVQLCYRRRWAWGVDGGKGARVGERSWAE